MEEIKITSNTYNIAPDPGLNIPEGEKIDLFEFLESQPDVNVELSPLPEAENEPAQDEKTKEEKKIEALASRIRSASKVPQIVPFATLFAEDEGVAELFEKLFANEDYKDILHVQGKKDTYYYSHPTMANSFALIAVNLAEGDDVHTMAHSIRVQAKFPLLTPLDFFTSYPFYMSDEQIKLARAAFKTNPAYEDIKEIEHYNTLFFYSTHGISEKFAPAYAQEVFMTKWGMMDEHGNIEPC
ncbi:MAG: hypothetical protein FWB74_02415 [Defluviitaleaceae bacterium]|nr:hypothetical protein [Defluviitaleaceae bacterium]